MSPAPAGLCACGCGETGKIAARGLLKPCYRRADKAGTLNAYPRKGMPLAEFLDRYTDARECGRMPHEIAAQLGIKPASLDRQLYRARSRGLLAAGPIPR